MRLTLLVVGFAICSFTTSPTPAQSQQQTAGPQQAAAPAPAAPETIAIGQSLDGAMEILRRRGVEFGEGHFSFTNVGPDNAFLHITLNPNHSTVCLTYSKSRRIVTGLSMVFIPSRLSGSKIKESWVSARAIFLYPDTTYAVHFTKPLTLEELNEREAIIRRKLAEPPSMPQISNPQFSTPGSPAEPRVTPSPVVPRN
jgi:hypothetical protein